MTLCLRRPEHHEFTAAGQDLDVQLHDGSRLTLLPLFEHGEPSRFHRAVRTGRALRAVDVRRLVRQLGDDLVAAPARDVPGLVQFTLRLAYPTAAVLLADIDRHGFPLHHTQGART